MGTEKVVSMMRYGKAVGKLTILGKRVADCQSYLTCTTVLEPVPCSGCSKGGCL